MLGSTLEKRVGIIHIFELEKYIFCWYFYMEFRQLTVENSAPFEETPGKHSSNKLGTIIVKIAERIGMVRKILQRNFSKLL